MILEDAKDPSKPIEVARNEIPYCFDVRSSRPRVKQLTGDHTQQADIGPSSNIRRRVRHLGQAAIPSPPASSQLAMGPHPEGIELMTGEFPDSEHAGQRASGHVSSVGELEQQNLSDVQRLPAIPVFHMLKPALPVQEVRPQLALPGGGDRDDTEGGQGSVIATRSGGRSLRIHSPPTPSASDADAQHISGSRGQPYNTLNNQPPFFAHVPLSTFSFPRMPSSTEAQIRVKVAERDVQINALETTIKRLKGTLEADGREKEAAIQPLFEYLHNQILAIQKEIANQMNAFLAERQKAEAAVSAQVVELKSQVHILKEENICDANVLTTIANTTK